MNDINGRLFFFVKLYRVGVKKKTVPYFSRKAPFTYITMAFHGGGEGESRSRDRSEYSLPESTEITKLSKSTQTVQDEIFSLESYNYQTSKEQTERSFDL